MKLRKTTVRRRHCRFELLESRALLSADGLDADPAVSDSSQSIFETTTASEVGGPHVADVQVPAMPVRTLSIWFSEALALPADANETLRSAFGLYSHRDGLLDTAQDSFFYDAAQQTLTWRSTSHLPPGFYTLVLDSESLRNASGDPLIGGTEGLCFSVPTFAADSNPEADGTPIRVDSYSVPSLADWNQDGLLDLVIGEKTTRGRRESPRIPQRRFGKTPRTRRTSMLNKGKRI